MMADIPHFSYPFSFKGANGHAREVEQDSVNDVSSCIAAIILTRVGQRYEVPEFGVSDPVFIEGGQDPDEMMRIIEFWEPRAIVALEENWDFATFTQAIRLSVDEEAKHG